MITAKAFAGKHYAVYGLARSGLATAEALLASGAKVTAWDDRLLPGEGRGPGQRDPLLSSGLDPGLRRGTEIANLNETDLSQFDSLVVTPGLPLNRHPIARRARDAGVEIIGDIELFARARSELPPHKVVGITGTNGKSTTTALIHHILKTAGLPTTMGGNIGLPILAQDPLPESGVYVLELSSYQIDLTTSLDCDVAVWLNISPDHLDRYNGSMASYFDAKARLFFMQSPGHNAVIVCSADTGGDELIDELCHFQKRGLNVSEVRGGGSKDGDVVVTDGWAHVDGRPIARQADWPSLQGPHNAENVSASIASALIIQVDESAISRALRSFVGLPHRMERIREKDGVLFVNDSKATNPTATAPALAAFPSIRWILGGQAKTDNLDECAPHFAHVRSAYTIGEAGELFAKLLAPHMPVTNCETLENAVNHAAEDSQPGDTVLLSPACASFDQFKDFEQRGDRFRDLVGAL